MLRFAAVSCHAPHSVPVGVLEVNGRRNGCERAAVSFRRDVLHFNRCRIIIFWKQIPSLSCCSYRDHQDLKARRQASAGQLGQASQDDLRFEPSINTNSLRILNESERLRGKTFWDRCLRPSCACVL